MRNRLSYVVFAALVGVGCNPGPAQMGDSGVCPTGHVCLMDSGPPDVGPRPDAFVVDTNEGCNGSGHVGSHCRTGTTAQCQSPSTCASPQAGWTTFQATFQIPSGILVDPAHPDYQLIDTSASAEVTPFNAFSGGGLCLQQCDTTAAAGAAGACGACLQCSTTATQIPLLAIFGGIRNFVTPMYGGNTGACRLECTYDITTSGAECPNDMTCEQFGNVCVEACTNDNECNTAYGVTYEGELVTIVNHMAMSTCNTTTGRCDGPAPAHAGANVGDHCDSNADCAPGVGICLSGGHCGEVGCPTPNTMTSTCGGTAGAPLGVCLSTSQAAHPTTICIMGCTTSSQCGAGSVCNTLWQDAAMTMPFPIGPFTGYCIGQCGRDEECNNSGTIQEACTDYNTVDAMTGAVTSNPGRCVNRCTALHAVGTATTATPGQCLTTEFCQPDVTNSNGHPCANDADCTTAAYGMCIYGTCHSSAPTFGECQTLGAFCGPVDTHSLAASQPDCASTQVCDETAATTHNQMTHAVSREQFGDGHCVNPCTTDAACITDGYPTGSVCVTTGPLLGLCRVPCTSTTTADAGMECPVDQVCDPALMFCVETFPPAA